MTGIVTFSRHVVMKKILVYISEVTVKVIKAGSAIFTWIDFILVV